MVPIASSQQNRRAEVRWQDRVIACFWLPFSLLFHVWVYFTPTYEEKWGLLQPARSHPQSRPPLQHSFLIVALVVTSVLGFTLFALMTLPPLASRLLLILVFGFSLWQLMRPKT
jgi:hypothetical protein